jgi:hypothetical protein
VHPQPETPPDPPAPASAPPARPEERRSLAFNIGAFFGHIVKAVRTDVQPTQVLRSETTQEQRDTPTGRVTIRRTTIEELRVEPPAGPESRQG